MHLLNANDFVDAFTVEGDIFLDLLKLERVEEPHEGSYHCLSDLHDGPFLSKLLVGRYVRILGGYEEGVNILVAKGVLDVGWDTDREHVQVVLYLLSIAGKVLVVDFGDEPVASLVGFGDNNHGAAILGLKFSIPLIQLV